MNTTVPAEARSGPAVAAGPTTRLATIASAPARSSTERLRIYSLHPSDVEPIPPRETAADGTASSGVRQPSSVDPDASSAVVKCRIIVL
jgi:hypothetical protein